MSALKPIKTALISVYNKDGLSEILSLLAKDGVKFISTGGTQSFIREQGYDCQAVEDLTGYPSILGGRVKTLHPKVFGGILGRRDCSEDSSTMAELQIPEIDLVIVDLYPFEQTVATGATHDEIIEKIDIGGISLIRAAAKNYKDVVIVASKGQYGLLHSLLMEHGAATTLTERTVLAREAFAVSSAYDSNIFAYMASQLESPSGALRLAIDGEKSLRYGENPHQEAHFFGKFEEMFDQLHGKEVSYNNLLDIDSAVSLIDEFEGEEAAVAILKHNNPCGLAVRPTLSEAWVAALAGDPVSAFGGIIICNKPVDAIAAGEITKIFFEVIIAPDFSDDAMTILTQKKNRIILRRKNCKLSKNTVRTVLNGVLVQHRDAKVEDESDLEVVSGKLTPEKVSEMLFANKIVKHSKSNAIVISKNGQLIGSGVGQTSRVDALKQAIAKAREFGFETTGATLASDAFFPFADCVELAHGAGIDTIIQPGGSIRDNESVEFCKANGMTMVMTGTRHFRH